MDEKSQQQIVINNYRDRAVWGGIFLGALAGAVAGGPKLQSWPAPIQTYLAYIFGSALVGCVAGYLFFKLALSNTPGGGPGSSEDARYGDMSDVSTPGPDYGCNADSSSGCSADSSSGGDGGGCSD